jgi:hypothetical protein
LPVFTHSDGFRDQEMPNKKAEMFFYWCFPGKIARENTTCGANQRLSLAFAAKSEKFSTLV